LAICDPDRILASPLATYEPRNVDIDAAYFRQVIAAEKVVGLVVGLPLHTDGREGVMADEARRFGKWLGEVTSLPVAFADERFTSIHAESALWNAGLTHKRRKARRDRVAAQMLLQAYLDASCPPEVIP
jgi:putative Holliday junction resolvase